MKILKDSYLDWDAAGPRAVTVSLRVELGLPAVGRRGNVSGAKVEEVERRGTALTDLVQRGSSIALEPVSAEL